MASFTKRNGRWRARVRRSGLPPITKSFPTKASALKWTQRVECDPESFSAIGLKFINLNIILLEQY